MEHRDPIRLVPYDPAWPALFEREAARLRLILQPYTTGPLEHMGSTSVPGLAAKPIIDMLATIRSYEEVRLPRGEDGVRHPRVGKRRRLIPKSLSRLERDADDLQAPR